MKSALDVFRKQLALGAPICLSLGIQFMFTFVDTVMLGHYDSTSLAISGLALACFNAIFILMVGFISSLGILFSRANGKGKQEEMLSLLSNGFVFTILLSIFSVLAINSLSLIIPIFSIDTALIGEVQRYLFALSIGLPGALFFLFFREFLNAKLRPKALIAVVLLTLPINALLDYIFLYGVHGFLKYGTVGVAYATSICDWIIAIVLGGFLLKSSSIVNVISRQYQWLSLRILKDIVKLGWPIALSLFLELFFFSVIACVLGYYEPQQLAAYQVVYQFISMAFIFSYGYSQAVSVQLGNYIGQKNEKQVSLTVSTAILSTLLIVLIMASLFQIFKQEMVGVILPRNSSIYNACLSLMPIVGIIVVIDGLQVVLAATCKVFKAAAYVMYASIVGYWLIGFILACFLLFVMRYGADGILIGLVFGLATYVFLLTLKVYRLCYHSVIVIADG